MTQGGAAYRLPGNPGRQAAVADNGTMSSAIHGSALRPAPGATHLDFGEILLRIAE